MSGEASGTELPAPVAEGLAGDFFAWHDSGELRFQRCAGCHEWIHPATVSCPACGGEGLEWTPVAGRGRIVTWTRTHFAFAPAFASGGAYVTVVVALDEGPQMVSLLRGQEGDPAIGSPVRVTFERRAAGRQVAVFEPDAR